MKLVLFPPNTTSNLQPLGQGIIKNLKMYYQKRILRRLIARLENDEPVDKFVDLRGAIVELWKVWECDVSESTIRNCFRKARFSRTLPEDEIDVRPSIEEGWSELRVRSALDDDVTLEDF